MIVEDVSIGPTCRCAIYLRKYQNRISAYPFDWVLTNPREMVYHIKTEFVHWLKDAEYITYQDLIGKETFGEFHGDNGAEVESKSRGMLFSPHDKFLFVHDFVHTDYEEGIKKVRETYQRRIDRFLNIPPDTFRNVWWDKFAWFFQLKTKASYHRSHIFSRLDPEKYWFPERTLNIQPHTWKGELTSTLNQLWGEGRWRYKELFHQKVK